MGDRVEILGGDRGKHADLRASPLRQADDAVVVDATDASLDEVVARVLALVVQRTGAAQETT